MAKLTGISDGEWNRIAFLYVVGAAAVLCFIPARAEEQPPTLAAGVAAYKRDDYATALNILRPLADSGNGIAENLLGEMYYTGKGLSQDRSTAMRWYSKSASHGIAEAAFSLGFMCEMGDAIPRDYVAALREFQRAANLGSSLAKVELSRLYRDGKGVPQDYVMAHMWVNLAIAETVSEIMRITLETDREMIERAMTRAQIGEAQKMAREWRPR